MIALFLRGKGDTFDSKVIALGATPCKSNFCWTRIQDIGYLFTSTIDGLHGMASKCVDTAGIAIFRREVRYHSIQDARI